MSDNKKSFIDLSLQGRVLLDEIDDFVDAWHEQPGDEPLHKYLGMKKAEYSLWLRDPEMLPLIVKARHDEVPLSHAVNDNIGTDRLAARSGEAIKLKRLRNWLKEQGKID
jgi:hypothetical protein